MNKKEIVDVIKKVKEISKKRNFIQTYDLIINLKDIDLKNPENHIDIFVTLPYSKGKKSKVCALVGPELAEQAKQVCDNVVLEKEFDGLTKKDIKKLAEEYDYFIAQANLMPKIASIFGKVLGPRKKMPNPKAGCIVPPKANLKPLYEKLLKMVRIMIKEHLFVQIPVGKEDMDDEQVAENIMVIYDNLAHSVPDEKRNIKSMYLKLTMGKPIKLV